MFKFFNTKRRDLIGQNNLFKYFLYAGGEVILVVVGILIALNINNSNEYRKQRIVEIEILEGIRNDILLDTVDMNGNIRSYQGQIRSDSIILDQLINKRDMTNEFVNYIYNRVFGDMLITLHQSHFDEAKQKGLSIITNKSLRTEISRLYEFDYTNLIQLENSFESVNSYKLLKDKFLPYFEQTDDGSIISEESYKKMTLDANAIFLIRHVSLTQEQVLIAFYIPARTKALEIASAIEKELQIIKGN
jgi:hypothetical protein